VIKVAVIGLGHLGKWHVDKVLACSSAELICAVDPAPSSKGVLEERGLSIPLYKTLEDCLEQEEFDAAFVVTPTSLHFDVCKKLLKEGKHVFCEKPLTSTYEQALELKSLKGRSTFQVGHSERFHAIWNQLGVRKKYLEDKPVLSLNRQAPFKGRATDVDVVQDLMIHDIDLVLYLLKEKPQQVLALGKKQRTDKWDYVKAFFSFESGAQATITVGRNHVCEVRELESVNSAGCLKVDLLNRKAFEASALAMDNFVQEENYDKRDHLLEEHESFYQAILDESEAIVSIDAGVEAVYFVELVLKSLENGRAIQC
jgi:predicted dehydrogenase